MNPREHIITLYCQHIRIYGIVFSVTISLKAIPVPVETNGIILIAL